jgi:5'-deoxynucleotidase YfbR-like HD superfamily hydrolase
MAKAAANRESRAWQRMLSGRRLDLLDPSPLDVEVEDIAHGLARVARWNGQTCGDWAYSVAQHCVFVEELVVGLRPKAPASWRLAALLHDAPEYVIGDLITPFKAAVGLDYKALEARLQAAVHIRFGLPAMLPKAAAALIKRADRAAAYYEAIQLAGFTTAEANRYFVRPRRPDTPDLAPWPPAEAKARYLARFAALAEPGPLV